MNSDWPLVQIDEIKAKGKGAIAIGPFGSRMKSNCYVDSGVPVIRGTNLGASPSFINDFVFITKEKADELGSCNVYEGDLVFPHRGSIGEVGIVTDGRYVLSSSLMKLRCDPHKAYPLFIYYFFKSTKGRHELLKNASQVGTPGIGQPLTSLKSIELPLPPLHIQKEIASILEMLDRKIQLNQQINQTLEQMAQAIFKSWFVDFEPVKAKIAALVAGSSEEVALLAAMQSISGKDADQLATMQVQQPEQYVELRATAELFPSAMQDSEVGDIPEGWEAVPFGRLLEKTIGGDWGKESADDKHTEKVRILRGTDLPKIHGGDDSKVPERFVEKKKLATRKLQSGDIVIEVSGGSKGQPTGRSLFITKKLISRLGASEPASFCRLFRPKNESLGLILAIHLQVIYAEGKTWQYQNQSTGISNFQTKVFLENELVANPQDSLISAFNRFVGPLFTKIHSDENIQLAELRDSLLSKLLSGEISVKDIHHNDAGKHPTAMEAN